MAAKKQKPTNIEKKVKHRQDTGTTEPQLDREEIHVGQDEIPRVYANNVSLRTSVYDIRLVFGEVLDATDEELKILDKVMIHMSPQHAKSVANLLNRNVAFYENTFGKLPDGDE